MATVFGIDHKYFAVSTIAVSVGVAVYTTYRLAQRSRNSSDYYETRKLVNEYLMFHYGQPKEVLAYEDFGPNDSLDFPKRCAELCLRHYKPGQPGVPNRALDIGCAVGRSTFELARVVEEAIGIDYSHAFVAVCNSLKDAGSMDYTMTTEGDLYTEHKAVVPQSISRKRTRFQQGDACSLPGDLGQFGVVLAANLICRLHQPKAFLQRLGSLVAPGGILVITAPYTWLEQFTDKSVWLGGYKDKDGRPVTGFDTLKKELAACFILLEDRNMPFLIKETARKHQWTVAHATVWQRK
ncbi:hypothetical protein BaRGS_00004424 [Batillaria attramentaria]|uniref:Methyltransferase type 11 domain-containing protein n=1 Tax=Batillaria attramentaria TaxID=370345 RepID=A0ABD0LY65_9CAEN